ncbi:GNAT family N-acetyltransferase [Paenibacillus sp. L3-i20]|uniref:GNAT family N-acetyltransferase n=1 Tax=Paenibacillus sp. L3-i20 TaxID=2905833 RepID=UPI001EDF166F|nr:GNAT family N-acetyltransferase [Paenibacillus sp. L3-i20]GKU77692.1 hypothetical protein L3i20_v220890 [Paenibacillus sp. L3-i20]
MKIHLRELQLPQDYSSLAELLNKENPEPTTAEALKEDDDKLYDVGHTWMDENGLLAGYDRTRRVAVNDHGHIVGYLYSWRAPWTEPGYLCTILLVDEQYRKQGIGTLLLQHMLNWAKDIGANAFMSTVWDDQPEALQFATHRGFIVERHAYQSVLNLKKTYLDENSISPDALLAKNGLRLLTLAEEPGEDSERKLYELSTKTSRDIPGFIGETPNYSDWLQWYLKVPGFTPELVIIAAHGDEFVGMTNVLYNEQSNGMYHEYTGVHRAYRGKKVARALKLKAIELGKLRGADYIRTDNDSLNEPILRINRSLGYTPLRGSFRLLAPLYTVIKASESHFIQSDVL